MTRRSVARQSPSQVPARSGPRGLADERAFLLSSIEDLERELAAAELDEEDFALLRARYGRRLVEVDEAIADLADQVTGRAGEGEDAASPPRALGLRRWLGNRRVRLAVGVAAACCFVAAAGLLAASIAGVRLPGESATGSISLSSAQQEQATLERAAVLGSEGQAAEAVQLYNEVLRTDPNQPDALTYGGWLIRLAGLSSKNQLVLVKGDASVARAVKVAPSYPDAHALLGVILYEDFGRPTAAVTQFKDALRCGASKSLLASVAPIAQRAFAAVRQPLPNAYSAAFRAAAAAGAG
ncbi:MAG: hypothetical protein ABSD85_12110 [Acidimicrobiales bacterium]